jgi:hypothetical protein
MGLENLPSGIERARRNLIKMGGIVACAIFAGLTKTTLAVAQTPGPPRAPLRFSRRPPSHGWASSLPGPRTRYRDHPVMAFLN